MHIFAPCLAKAGLFFRGVILFGSVLYDFNPRSRGFLRIYYCFLSFVILLISHYFSLALCVVFVIKLLPS